MSCLEAAHGEMSTHIRAFLMKQKKEVRPIFFELNKRYSGKMLRTTDLNIGTDCAVSSD